MELEIHIEEKIHLIFKRLNLLLIIKMQSLKGREAVNGFFKLSYLRKKGAGRKCRNKPA